MQLYRLPGTHTVTLHQWLQCRGLSGSLSLYKIENIPASRSIWLTTWEDTDWTIKSLTCHVFQHFLFLKAKHDPAVSKGFPTPALSSFPYAIFFSFWHGFWNIPFGPPTRHIAISDLDVLAAPACRHRWKSELLCYGKGFSGTWTAGLSLGGPLFLFALHVLGGEGRGWWKLWLVRKGNGLRHSVTRSLSALLLLCYVAFLHVNSTSKQRAPWQASLRASYIRIPVF